MKPQILNTRTIIVEAADRSENYKQQQQKKKKQKQSKTHTHTHTHTHTQPNIDTQQIFNLRPAHSPTFDLNNVVAIALNCVPM
jgi:hypothetical protein